MNRKMHTLNSSSAIPGGSRNPLSRNSLQVLAAALLMLAACLSATSAQAAGVPVFWDGGTAGTNLTYLTAASWNPDGVPGANDLAIFDSAGTATTITIPMTTAGGVQQVGAIALTSGNSVTRGFRNNSTGTAGVIQLNGYGGILLSNASAVPLILSNNFGSSLAMGIRLGTSGEIYVATDGNTKAIIMNSSISETNGSQGFTKTGAGILYLQGTNNTFTGSVTNSAGAIKMNDTATFGTGVAPVYLTGGNIISGLDRGGAADPPIANPMVLSADTFIYSDGGNANSSRTIPFSGSWTTTAGTLSIANLTANTPNTFVLRLSGGFTFTRPIVVGTGVDTPGSTSALSLYNAATNGIQTFSGDISGSGVVRRQGSTLSAGGTTVLTGNNTYSGGTAILYGTILANGGTSALGSGGVTVATNGVLGGNGNIVAPTSINFGGAITPGSSGTNVGTITISDFTLTDGSSYVYTIDSATGTDGVARDLISATTWTDGGTGGTPITIKLDSHGAVPTGWNSGTARDWVIIQGGFASGFNVSHFALDTTAFTGTIQGIFSLSLVGNDLHLIYTPASDIVLNVPSGTQSQSALGYPQLTGSFGVLKVGNGEAIFDNAANDYAGTTKIYAGTGSLAVDAANGSGGFGAASTSVLVGNTTGNSNATLNINTAGVTLSRNITVQSGSSGTKTIGTSIGSGTANFVGNITLQDSATLNAASGSTATFSGTISGSGNLAFGGGGTITLPTLNTYGGTSTLNGGTLLLNAKALSTNTFTIASSSTIDNTSGATVTLNNCPINWNADLTFTGSTNLNLGAGPVTLSGNRSITATASTLTVGGTIGGAGSLTKLGSGTLALTASTNSSYTGATTNAAGVISVNATATFGDGTGPLVFTGGKILDNNTRAGAPIANPVIMVSDAIIYGDSTAAPVSSRFLPFTGTITSAGGALKIGNTGLSSNIFALRLQGTNQNSLTCPIVIGDSAFDTPGAVSQLDLYCDTNNTQTISGLITGNGTIRRGAATLNTGGTTIFTAMNTFTGGVTLVSGTIGFGTNTTTSGGAVTAGPVGTGTFTIGSQNNEAALTVFASGAARVIDNRLFLDGPTNIVVAGTNDLTLTGSLNAGGVSKTWTILNTGLTTLSGQISNSASGLAPLVKTGPGTLVLSGNNLYGGGTTINAGKLLANNTYGSATGPSNVVVNAGGTLGGTGSISGLVLVGGTITPGQSAGNLTLAGGLDLSSGGTYAWELAANSTNNPGTDFDLISLTGGSLVPGGASKISINFTGTATSPDATNAFWQVAHTWKIIALSGTATNPGPSAFPTVLNGSYGAGTFTNYTDPSGNIILAFAPGSSAPPPLVSPNIVGAGTASATVSWSSVNGVTYQLQYKTNLSQTNWLVVGNVTASGTTASLADTTGPSPARFYRVIVP